ncbi:MAG: hypothetical protein WKF88_11175 [Ferruginibacter sp.]
MKKLFLFAAVAFLSVNAIAQGKSKGKGHGNGKEKSKMHKEHNDDDDRENSGKYEQRKKDKETAEQRRQRETVNGRNQTGKMSKNQPKKVQAALLRDYPNATNIVWSKYKGDYTATFNNGVFRSTAVYHANGARKDTRTALTRQQMPGTIWDGIFQRDNVTPTSYTQIERPSMRQNIYRILAGNTAYYYDANGNRVQYNY